MSNVVYLTAEDVALRIGVGHVVVYGGIDTRPKTGRGVPLPVAYYCRGHGIDWEVEAGDVVGFLNLLPIGEDVVMNGYWGVDAVESDRFVSTQLGWVHEWRPYEV